MPIDFPFAPTTGQVYTYLGKSWVWNGTAWDVATSGKLEVVVGLENNFLTMGA
jgi:hypothetical protein